jgi:hypothetical protein
MKLSKDQQNRLILAVSITLAAIAAVYYVLVVGTRLRLGKARDALAKSEAKYLQAERFLQDADRVEEELRTTRVQLDGMESQMAPVSDPYRWGYDLMRSVATNCNVEIIEVTPPQECPVGLLASFPYKALSFSVRGFAYYEAMGAFLAELENRFPFFRTQNLFMSTVTAGGASAGGSSILTVRQPEQIDFRVDVVALVKPST